MIFLRPWFLLLLLILPLFAFYIKKNSGKYSAWAKIVDKELLSYLSNGSNNKNSKLIWWFNLLALFSLIIAISGPSWHKTEINNYKETNAVMIALDLSSDSTPQDVDNFKFYIQDIINETKDIGIGLVAYSDEPFLISPITEDKNIIKNLLPQIDRSIMPTNGNDVNKAKKYANQKLKDAGYNKGEVIVLSTNQKTDIKNIINNINTLSTQLKQSQNQSEQWQDMGYYFLILPALVCLYLFRKGLFVFALLFSFNASANVFENNNQKAHKLFEAKDYKNAATTFDNQNWQASSLYKAEDYKNAINLFSDPYNKANAMAKSGDIEGAIKTYEEVLKNNPNHEDAKFNLEYLKKQQQQQQNQSSKQNQDNQDSQDNKDNKDNQDNKDSQDNQDNKDNQDNQNQNKNQDNQDNQKDDQDKDSQDKDNQNDNDNNNDNNQNNQDDKNNQGKEDNNKNSNSSNNNDKDNNKDDKGASSQSLQEALGKNAQKTDKKEGEEQEIYTEQLQAREQKFREIPEDAGGLLRAFIYKEYQQRLRGQQ